MNSITVYSNKNNYNNVPILDFRLKSVIEKITYVDIQFNVEPSRKEMNILFMNLRYTTKLSVFTISYNGFKSIQIQSPILRSDCRVSCCKIEGNIISIDNTFFNQYFDYLAIDCPLEVLPRIDFSKIGVCTVPINAIQNKNLEKYCSQIYTNYGVISNLSEKECSSLYVQLWV